MGARCHHCVVGPELLAVILTGMGADGKVGAGAVADAGGTVMVQDDSWG